MTRYLSLAEFWFLAEQVTGIDATTLLGASRVDLADSALHAPQAGFDDTDFYPDIVDKAAVLPCRIAWNHPLPDGNSVQRGRRWCCSSISTAAGGNPVSLTLMTLSKRCLPSLRERSMKLGSPDGFACGCRSPTELTGRSDR